MKTYLIDYELIGSFLVEANNPQAAAARGQSVLRAVHRGLSGLGDEPDMTIYQPIDLATKMCPPTN